MATINPRQPNRKTENDRRQQKATDFSLTVRLEDFSSLRKRLYNYIKTTPINLIKCNYFLTDCITYQIIMFYVCCK